MPNTNPAAVAIGAVLIERPHLLAIAQKLLIFTMF